MLCQSRGRRGGVGGVTAQLMSDFQMSRVSRQPVLTPMQGLSQVQTTPFEGGSLPGTQLLSAPLGRALAQTQDACNGGRAGCETITMGVCTGAAGRAARLPHWPDDWYAPGSEQLLLASFILQLLWLLRQILSAATPCKVGHPSQAEGFGAPQIPLPRTDTACGLRMKGETPVNSTMSIGQARKMVEQLKIEASLCRIKVSKAAADLMTYCDAHACEDPLITPVPTSENPFREKKFFCALL
uniref:Guanine nucleotide-binding protein subunit gamma n=1 Tax=Sus scrofa TaxID=9823 RepID=A0A4X1VN10_PIG